MAGSDSRMVTRRMVAQTPAPLHARRLLELRIGVAQRGAHQQERQRRPQEALDQHHAGHGIDVDQHVGRAGQVAVELVDRPGLAEHQEPGRDIENVGRAERDDRGHIGEPLERRIGALDDPGHDPADQQRDGGAAGRERQRVEGGGDESAGRRARSGNSPGPSGWLRRARPRWSGCLAAETTSGGTTRAASTTIKQAGDPAGLTRRRRAAVRAQPKRSSKICFHLGMLLSIVSGVKKRTRKWPSSGLSAGSSAGTAGSAVM